MDSCFPVGNTGLIALVLHFYSAGFSVPVADNQTPAVRGFVTAPAPVTWRGREKPGRSPVINLTALARWPQETGSCEVIRQQWLSDKLRVIPRTVRRGAYFSASPFYPIKTLGEV
jgi:hypothetical protein